MKEFKTKFITLALASAFIAVGYSTAASADSVEATTPNSTPTISLRSTVEFQGGGSKQFTYIKDYANGYLAYDNWSKRYVYVVTRNPAGVAFYVVSKNFVYSV